MPAEQVGETDRRRRRPSAAPRHRRRRDQSAVTLRRLRRELDQRLARGRRGLPDLHAAALDAVRAGGASLVGRERGVALDIFDLVDADAELLGRDLRNGDPQPLAEIDLAAEYGHRAVGVDGEEGIDLLGIEHARRCSAPCASARVAHAGECEADGERAALENGAAGETQTF